MKFLFMLPLFLFTIGAFAQSDIDVVLMKSGTRYECEILKIHNDSIFFKQFSGSNTIKYAYPIDETAIYLVNNFYSTPGEELTKSSRRMAFGAGIILLGGTLSVLGNKDDRDNLSNIGLGVMALGSVVTILGIDNLRKVGRKIDKVSYRGDRLIFKL